MNNPDTVSVRLSAEGQKHEAGKTLTVYDGRVSLTFTGAEPQNVHVTLWREVLSTTMPYGQPFFELVPDEAAHTDGEA